MARFNEILVGRFNRALQKFVGIKGPSPTPSLASEIIPVFPFYWGVENRYLEQWNRFGIALQVGAVAAQNSAVEFRNPAGSNIIAVVEKISFTNQNSGSVTYFTSLGSVTTDFSSPQNAFLTRFDARSGPAASLRSNVIVSQQNNATLFGLTFSQVSLATLGNYDLILTDNQEITVLPGDALLVNTGVNLQLNMMFLWRERLLEESERF